MKSNFVELGFVFYKIYVWYEFEAGFVLSLSSL